MLKEALGSIRALERDATVQFRRIAEVQADLDALRIKHLGRSPLSRATTGGRSRAAGNGDER